MHVLIISPVDETAPGGIASHLSALRRALGRVGISSEILAVEDSAQARFSLLAITVIRKVLNCIASPLGFVVADYALERRLQKLLRNVKKPDLIHCHALYADWVRKTAQQMNVPIVLTVHGYIANEAVSRKTVTRDSVGYKYLLAKEKRIYDAADHIICVDSRISDHVRHIADSKVPLTVIPNSVDTDVFQPSADNQSNIVLCPRVLNPKNGVIVAIKAMEFLKDHPSRQIRLVIAGDGRERATCEAYVDEHGLRNVVTFLGNVAHDKMPELIKQAGVVVVPSIPSEGVEEATSVAALEAMASGIPVVASRIGGLREIIIDGETGYLVSPNEPKELADAIGRALEERTTLGAKAAQVLRDRFGLEVHAKRVQDVYQQALSRS